MREALRSAARRISRRRFLALAAAAPMLPLMSATALSTAARGRGAGVVMHNGWVLREDDRARLRLP